MPAAKPRSGPSGYLKLLKRPSDHAVTAVKKQLGSLYTEDGPPLGVDFDSLPPSNQNRFKWMKTTVRDKAFHQLQGFEIGSSASSSLRLKRDRASFKVPQGSDGLDNVGHQKCKQSSSPGYYSDGSLEMSTKGVTGSDSRYDFAMRYSHGVEETKVGSVIGGKLKGVQESGFNKHGEASQNKFPGEYIEHLSTTNCTNECDNIWTLALPCRGSAKDARIGRTGGSKVEIPKKNNITASKRPMEGLPPQQEPSTKKHLWRLHAMEPTQP
ncbi:uncharacterized protein LOC127258698 [Andrographis paniculata]|uniref:uncharacterized protein LOC127258698 n=1 Tax=Andrographis paniculata TaxID=175694 RepID=UPI0021E7EA31|nr:uncharacterized protein LOC127258698 [Andrographis paniculata]XP_051141601.1 uncharacterized protein LOC127258698 [Andrographis paniculata]